MDDQTPSSPYGAEELRAWRDRLVDEARRIGADFDQLDAEIGPGVPITPSTNHPAEGATDLQDQTIAHSQAEGEAELRQQILRALRKIDDEDPLPFGLCEHTLEPIEAERLDLIPWTPYSAAASAKIEQEGLTQEDLLYLR